MKIISSALALSWLDCNPVVTLSDLDWGHLKPGTKLGEIEALFPRKDKTVFKSKAPAEVADTSVDDAGLISIDQFMAVDLRTARIKTAEPVPKSRKLMRLMVELAKGEERQIIAGIADSYEAESLVGRTVVVVANLKAAKLMGQLSQGMLLAASVDGKAKLVGFDADVPPGSQVR